MFNKSNFIVFLTVILVLCVCFTDAKKKTKGMVLRRRETNAVDFIRLSVMRLIYGIATRVGLGEQISEALNGAFVPPGVDDYDYGGGGGGLFDAGDDYDY